MAAAVQRLASVEVNGTVMVNNPLYQLLDVDLGRGAVSATFTTVPFADHALTTELTEGELLAAVAATRDNLPLRDAYLPSIDTVFDLPGRACVGGTVSVLAIARQRAAVRDYVLFTQERSATVLNLAGMLAVLPKGFHQPTGEPADEVRLWATLQREFEEELLGRRDLEQIGRRGPPPRRPAPRSAPDRADGLAPRPPRLVPRRVHRLRIQPRDRELRVRLPH